MVRETASTSASPFSGPAEPASFFRGPAQEEALARLEWLVTERQRCGLVVAESGMGKSHLAVAAARRLGGLGAETTLFSLAGIPEGDWIDLLLDRLPLDAASRAEAIKPWLKLENHLRENALIGRPVIFIFDDIDQAPADAQAGIGRLAASPEPRFGTTTIIATARPAGVPAVPDAVRQRAAVRIELTAWSEDEVVEYLAESLARSGQDRKLFSSSAAATIQRFATGVPEIVRRLAHLSFAAAGSAGLARVDPATVEAVWRELAPKDGATSSFVEPTEKKPEATPPQVRVVRRLWG